MAVHWQCFKLLLPPCMQTGITDQWRVMRVRAPRMHPPIKLKRNHQAFRLLLDAHASKQWPLHQLRIPSACRHAFGLLVSGAYPWPGKRLSNAPEHMATLASLSWRPHILFPAASAWKNPLVFGGEKGISLEKFKCPSLAAWPHALLSSSCAKTMPQSSRCWLPPDIKDQDSLQFRTPRVTD